MAGESESTTADSLNFALARYQGTSLATGLVEEEREMPGSFVLYPNYPNPFNPSTVITFDLPRAAHVRLIVYDRLGREVARLVEDRLAAGTHRRRWEGSGRPSGTYFYRLRVGEFQQTGSMTLTK